MRKLWILATTAILALTLCAGTIQATTQGSAASSVSQTAKAPRGEKLDINSATKEQLQALPGIGEAFAQKIIDHRPYRTKRDLVLRRIIPQPTYDKIKDQIIAHQSTAKAPPKK